MPAFQSLQVGLYAVVRNTFNRMLAAAACPSIAMSRSRGQNAGFY
jgi:hypothetical protein